MAKFENTAKITAIEFKQNIQCYCPLGSDFYTNQISVSMNPGKIIPDYCDVERFMRDMAGKELSIEDAVSQVYDYMMTYEPIGLQVSSYADDAVHFPVTVTKIMEDTGTEMIELMGFLNALAGEEEEDEVKTQHN